MSEQKQYELQQELQFQEDEIHLRDYVHILKKRKVIAAAFALLTILTVTLFTFSVTPLYKAETKVLVERNQSSNSLMNGMAVRFDPEFQETQFEIIKSNNVAHRVIKRLQLDTRYRNYFLKSESKGWLSTTSRSIRAWIRSFFSASSSDQATLVVDSNNAINDADRIVKILQANTQTTPIRNTKVVNISYKDPNPIMASKVVNAIIDSYMDEIQEIKMNTSHQAIRWMTVKAGEEKKKLEDSERALQKYRRDNNIVTVENKLVITPEKLSDYSSQLSHVKSKRKELEEFAQQIRKSGENFNAIEAMPIFAANAVLQRIRDKIVLSEQKITELSQKYGRKHPLLIQAGNDKDILLNEKRREIQRIISVNDNQYQLQLVKEKNLEELFSEAKQDMLNLNEMLVQYNIMAREVESNRVLYDSLMGNIKQNSASDQSQMVNIWIIQKSKVPQFTAYPKKKKNLLLGLVLGIMGGCGLAFFVEYLDNTIKNVEDLEKRFSLPVLGVIDQIFEKGKEIETIALTDPRSPLVESFKTIRSAILLSSPDHPPKSMLVTSVGPGEGKTSITINLARTLAQTDRTVLIIDCDMRKPRMNRVLKVANKIGLASYLSGGHDLDIIVDIEEKNISFIPTGPIPPNPSELLGSKRMQELLADMGSRFDFIILDSPPILSVTDSQILSGMVGGCLMVAKAGATTYDMLGHGIKLLNTVHASIIGIVVNGMSKKVSGDYYYYGGYYKQYYYGSEPTDDSKHS